MAERLELPADVVGAGTGFHADQAGWDVRQSLSELGRESLIRSTMAPRLS